MTRTATESYFSQLTDAAYAARDTAEFLAGIRNGFRQLQARLLGPETGRKKLLKQLDDAFLELRSNPRRKRILELCAWPIFDKPALPVHRREKDFLWLFTLPFLVKFKTSALSTPIVFEPNCLDAGLFLGLLEDEEVLCKEASLRCFPTLLRREDMHNYGPREYAQFFIEGEAQAEADVQGVPLLLDEELESHRTVSVFLPCAARLPVGTSKLFENVQKWPSATAAAHMHSQLLAQGLEVEAVVSLPPSSLAEAMFSCFGAGLVELEMNLLEAQEMFGALEVSVVFPATGYAEVRAVKKDGTTIEILPAIPLVEPKRSLHTAVSEICESHRIQFRGSAELTLPATSLLQ